DLLPAIDAVIGGGKFVSSGLEAGTEMEAQRCHDVEFYSDDAAYLERVASFIAKALNAGNPAVVVATGYPRQSLLERLRGMIDIDGAVRRGLYIAMDAADTLSQVMVNGLPDPVLCAEGTQDVIARGARATGAADRRIAIFGECASLLCLDGNTAAA